MMTIKEYFNLIKQVENDIEALITKHNTTLREESGIDDQICEVEIEVRCHESMAAGKEHFFRCKIKTDKIWQ